MTRSHSRFGRAALVALLIGIAGASGCGGEDPSPSAGAAVDVLHLRCLHGKGTGVLRTPAPVYYPEGLWAVIQERFPGQHERGAHPWHIEAFELRPQVDGALELDLVDHTKGAGGVAGRPLGSERWTLEAGERHVLLLATGPDREGRPGASAFRALLLGLKDAPDFEPGRVSGVAHALEVGLPAVPESAPTGRWHEIGDPGLPVTDLMGFLGSLEREFQLVVWAPDPTAPVSYRGTGGGPQIHGREVVKGEYDHPVVAVALRFP